MPLRASRTLDYHFTQYATPNLTTVGSFNPAPSMVPDTALALAFTCVTAIVALL